MFEPGESGADVESKFRSMGTPDLPDDPTPEQLDAWLALAELAADEDFLATTRRNAAWVQMAAGRPADPAELMNGAAPGRPGDARRNDCRAPSGA